MHCDLNIGVDVGSTTIKIVIIDNEYNIIYSNYKRHNSDIKTTFENMLLEIKNIIDNKKIKIKVSGSGGLLISEYFKFEFIQEVIASTIAIKKFIPKTDVAIELGGEDAKVTYFGLTLDQRMNGACAGGTGAFIDQMAILLNTDSSGLNELAKDYTTIYPVASRCGVFAKSDVQPLINEGIDKEDIAASILQAVVNQTISGLSAGKQIKGNVAYLGGPLTYLSELRNAFTKTLNLKDNEVIFPKNSIFYVAIGTAISAFELDTIDSNNIYKELESFMKFSNDFLNTLEPLFKDKDDYNNFKKRHNQNKIKRKDISEESGNLFIGIDAGSTTSKLVLLDENENLVYSFYSNNNGQPLNTLREAIIKVYKLLPKSAKIVSSSVTGYGEQLIKKAFLVDFGEIETIAHYKAGLMYEKDVDFILDIGGQDMKSLKIKNGVIESIMLNEACSSGCGSFIETFSKSLGIEINSFVENALFSKSPVDLGTRCTVFMNSRVKQSQKEGASIGDIAAGISYSIIKNALFKVIRLKDTSDLGEKIVVQGGTFYNDAVLKALEIILGKEVIRPDIAGLMGALGSAIVAKENYKNGYQTTFLNLEKLEKFSVKKSTSRCKLCGNQCLLSISEFNDNRRFISGNRCDRGAGIEKNKTEIINMYDYKYKRIFDYTPLSKEEAINGEIGIPRVLNLYENYPFWFRFLTDLKYRVLLSNRSSQKIFQLGMSSIPSESVCYPAKLVHGHIENLVNRKIENIFYPSIPFGIKEDISADNHFNCPVVTSYPETIRANMESLYDNNINYMNDFYPIYDENKMLKKVIEVFSKLGHSKKEIKNALNNSYKELGNYKKDIRLKGEEILEYIEKNNIKGIVLAGRPYHIDPEINHGIANVIQNYDIPVLTEDSISHLVNVDRPIRIVDQWAYHTRLYNAAKYISNTNSLEMIQLNSFGCGLDAITSDQIKEILERNNKIYTNIKIDEINNLGAARIRIRSLLAVMNKRKLIVNNSPLCKKIEFTKKMKNDYTILAPQMAPIHFEFIENAFQSEGYNLQILKDVSENTVTMGLKYVHNDACYPSIIIVGQIMEAINSNKYNTDKLAVIISQTGGGCRATNYIAFIRKALKDANMGHIPVISLNAGGLEKNSGFKLKPNLLVKLTMSLIYGDLLSKVVLKTRPYEVIKGSVDKLYSKWKKISLDSLVSSKMSIFKNNIRNIINEFDEIELNDIKKPKVGIVGEILVKFHPSANNNIIEFLETEGAEVVVPGLTDFMLYSSYNAVIRKKMLYESNFKSIMGKIAINYFEYFRKDMKEALNKSNRFTAPLNIETLAKKASEILSLGHQSGEGWFLTSEMLELIESDVNNIACIQPFACLPNHITGKAMIKKIRTKFPNSNIIPIDYDPGSSKTNQINRLKLMLSTAKSNIK
jgi:predicted CoA-substrate-specific enzyme activase